MSKRGHIMMEVTDKGRACVPEGLRDGLDQLNKVCLKVELDD